jgi:hypothetical protein
MRHIAILLLILAIASAVQIKMIAEKDTAFTGEKVFNLSVSYDCNKTIRITTTSENNALADVMVFLYYEEVTTTLLASGKTNEKGEYEYNIIGNPKNMRGVFSITLEKRSFKTKRASFVLPDPCLETQPPKKNESSENVGNVSVLDNKTNASDTIKNESKNESKQATKNVSKNETKKNESNAKTNTGKSEDEEDIIKSICPAAPLFFIIWIFVFLTRSRKRPNRT